MTTNLLQRPTATAHALVATEDCRVTIYYCKAGLGAGTPVRIEQRGIVYDAAKVAIREADATMWHDNSTGKAKRSGARCVLILSAGIVEFVGVRHE